MAENKPARKPEANGSTTQAETQTETQPAPSFEQGLEQLESIVKEMESGELALERALDLFERGMKLSERCRKQLADAETRVEILTRRSGEMEPEPFETGRGPSLNHVSSDDDDDDEAPF